MKNLLLLSLLIRPLCAQGTLDSHQFEAVLLPIATAPAGTPAGTAHFEIVTYAGSGERRISGSAQADLNTTLKISFARIDTASGFVVPAPEIHQDCPSLGGGGGPCEWWAEWSLPYSDATITEMQRGEWRISLGLETSPDAIITVQLQPVPEPSALLLIGLGLMLLFVFRFKTRPGIKLALPLLLLAPSLLAQGTLTFRADLLPLPSAPVGTPGNVQFGFGGPVGGGIDTIHGYAEINASNLRILFARVETAGGALIADATTIAMSCASGVPPSQCDWYAEWFLPYSNAQRDQLLAGEWHVLLGLESSPDAIISGQLQPVPEPSALAIVGSFFCLLALPRRRSA